jgi:erythromycin esterase-like protein
MKKTKTEAERDLLAKNHKRMNKEISILLDENKDLRERLGEAKDRAADLHIELDNKHADDRRYFATAALHTLMLNAEAYKAPDQIAEQAWSLADAMMRAK